MATDVMESARRDASGVEEPEASGRVRRELAGLILATVAVLLVLSLASFRLEDGRAENWIGPVGAFTADALYFTFGMGAWLFGALAVVASWALFGGRRMFERTGEIIGAGLMLWCVTLLLGVLATGVEAFGHPVSGLMGRFAADVTMGMIGHVGAVIVGVAGVCAALLLLAEVSLVRVMEGMHDRVVLPLRQRRALRRMAREHAESEEEGEEDARSFVKRSRGRRMTDRVRTVDREEEGTSADDGGTLEVGTVDIEVVSAEASDEVSGELPEVRGFWGRMRDSLRRGRGWSRVAAPEPGERVLVEDEPAWVQEGVSGSDGAAGEDSEELPPPPPQRSARSRRGADANEKEAPASSGPVIVVREPVVESSGEGEEGDGARGGTDVWFDSGEQDASAVAPTEARGSGAVVKQRSSLAERLKRLSGHGEQPAVKAPRTERPESVRQADAVAGVDAVGEGGGSSAACAEELDGAWEDDGARDESVEVEVVPRAREVQAVSAEIGPMIVESAALRERKAAADLERVEVVRESPDRPWQFPPLSFLGYEESPGLAIDRAALKEQAAQLEEVLEMFKAPGRVTNIVPGPVVTMFEFEPDPGIKVSKISGLSDDIAMALKARHVRVIAPIPGKGCVGVEVPNLSRETVFLKEILADDKFVKARSKLAMGLGKDIEGNPVVEDLAKMPHLLVAGTTGSGKSVAINAMITSILYNASPDDVRMIMIDPKQLELAIYEGVPHLLLPVVTDPAKAATALNWAVVEMERRYTLLKEMKVRNVSGYNEKLRELMAKHPRIDVDSSDLTAEEEMLAAMEPSGKPRHAHMPMLVVVIDEFADLIMVAGKEVEVAVARLAQKARAAGIHVILATQRPSTDVITGLIKANFPTRMSFRLISGVDSRTVLDTQGAEALLGMGDMLYRPPGRSELVRVHGAWVDEGEIEQVVEFLRKQRPPEYDESILQPQAGEGGDEDDEPVDDLYDEAVAVVFDRGFASISMVQRELKVGYNRAARMVEHMEKQGIVGPSVGGSSRRDVIAGAYGG